MKKIIGLSICILIGIFWISGCSNSSSTLLEKDELKEISLKKSKEEQLRIDVNVGYGNVTISQGAKDLINGNITYNHSKLEPEVTDKSKGKKRVISIGQSQKLKTDSKAGLKNNWELQIANDIPVDLQVSTGAAEAFIDLKGMRISNLAIEGGVGSTTVDLGGEWLDSFNVQLELGVGETTLILPKDIGVQVQSEKGIGTTNVKGLISKGEGVYENEAYQTNNDVRITVQAEIGVGEANFIIVE